MADKVRVRFAPSPTGYMHLGNVRSALFNYLFARKKGGVFVLRIEDTDSERNISNAYVKIIQDLHWLGLTFDEGPELGGQFAPYVQSERIHIYQEKLEELIADQGVYRCFCTQEELQHMRKRQLALRKPPRYNRRCLELSDDMIKQRLLEKRPFVWRLKLNHDAMVKIHDMARGLVTFELQHFSDPALTRSDGSFTFMFANFVDDWLMEITHVIRGEDHLTNTAIQAALFDAFKVTLPTFWHLPLLCNGEGQKLSKRDVGFTLDDLKSAGYMPEAIIDYLVLVGSTMLEEVQSLDELVKNIDFSHLHGTGAIRYDVNKLKWLNHKWIERLSDDSFFERVKPFLIKEIPESEKVAATQLKFLVSKVKTDLKTLADVDEHLAFVFRAPLVDRGELDKEFGADQVQAILDIVAEHADKLATKELFLDAIKQQAKEQSVGTRELFGTIRYMLTGSLSGIGMHDLLDMLSEEEIRKRFAAI